MSIAKHPLSQYNIFVIQYSHDGLKWFGYGADAVTPANEYGYGDVQTEYSNVLSKWHKPYPATYVRIYGNGKIIQQNELSPMYTVTRR